jgi:hypothetical protein
MSIPVRAERPAISSVASPRAHCRMAACRRLCVLTVSATSGHTAKSLRAVVRWRYRPRSSGSSVDFPAVVLGKERHGSRSAVRPDRRQGTSCRTACGYGAAAGEGLPDWLSKRATRASVERSLGTFLRVARARLGRGQDLVIEYRWAEGKIERLPDLAADLVRRNVDVTSSSSWVEDQVDERLVAPAAPHTLFSRQMFSLRQ